MLIRLILLLSLCSCASISTLQTAKTTDAGKFDHVIALGSVKADIDTVSGVEINDDDLSSDSVSLPSAEYMIRYGINDSFDLGLRTTGFMHGLDIKWNFVESESFLMSVGVGASILGYTVNTGSEDLDVSAVDITPAIYMDLVFDEQTRFYLVPKMISRKVSITGRPDDKINLFGGSAGLKWGKTIGVFLEYTLMTGSYRPLAATEDNDVSIGQIAAGVFF